jgi:hypothetical protein
MNILLKSLKILDAQSPEHPPDDEDEEEAILDAAQANEIMAVAQADVSMQTDEMAVEGNEAVAVDSRDGSGKEPEV